MMREFVDESSGLKYHKKQTKVPTQSIEPLVEVDSLSISDAYDDDLSFAYSYCSDKTTETIVNLINRPHVPSTEWLKYIPKEWNETTKLRQVIVWTAEMNFQDESRVKTGSITVAEKTKKNLIDKLKSSSSIISLFKHPDVLPPIRVHPKNIKNIQLLEEYQEDIVILKKETEQWKQCEYTIYELQATAMDTCAVLEVKGLKLVDSSNLLETVELDQGEYIQKLLRWEEHIFQQIGDNLYNLQADISHYRQKLHILNEFNNLANKLSVNNTYKIARLIKENTRIVPIRADEITLGLFEETEVIRKREEIHNLERIFRLLYNSEYSAFYED